MTFALRKKPAPRPPAARRGSDEARGAGRPPADADAVLARVLETAAEQYMRLGFSAVTTDETARAAGISKKTLYQHFPSKEDLLRAVVRRHSEHHNAAIRGICRERGCSVMHRLRNMTGYLSRLFGEVSPALMHDMRRSNPEVWNEVERNRQRCVHEDFGALLKEGRARGDFRKDVDAEVFMLIYAETVRNVLNPQAFARLGLPPARVYDAVTKVLFEGILTDKARKEPS
jgi:AcrR family transcriptional regulator